MRDFNRLNRLAVPAALIAALGMGACSSSSPAGSSEKAAASASPTSPASVDTKSEAGDEKDFVVRNTYTGAGHRITVYTSEDYGTTIERSYAYCDGPDLVERDSGYLGGSSTMRSVAHPACADGKLTPSDFKLQQRAAD